MGLVKYHAAMRCCAKTVTVIAIFCCMLPAALAAAQREPIVTTDLLRIRSVSSIDVVQRDGSRAVFAVKSIATLPADEARNSGSDSDAEPSYAYRSHLFLLDLTNPGAVPRQITFGDRHDHSPKFSPDGRFIAFLRNGDPKSALPPNRLDGAGEASEPLSQVWIIPVDGGEARQLTQFKHGCSDPQWSPDGRYLLVRSRVALDELAGTPNWPMERPRRSWKDASKPGIEPRPDGTRDEIRAWLERNAQQANPNVITRLDFQDEQRLRDTMCFWHLFLVDARISDQPVTEAGARRITNGFFDHEEPAFMPDGQSVVYAAKKPRDRHIDRVLSRSLWRVAVDGTNDREILAREGWSFASPKPSRDGAVIAFRGRPVDEPAFRQWQLGMVSLNGETVSDPLWLTEEASFPGSVREFEWMPTQPALVFRTAMRGEFPLMTVSPGLLEPAKLVGRTGDDEHAIGVNTFAVGGGTIVYSQSSIENPCVLRVRDGRGDRLVFDLNPWVANKLLAKPVEGWIDRPDGTRVQYWLMEPTRREHGKKYPLVLEIHGGPSAMWGPGEFGMWHELQLFCSWGYGVVYANPRGSGGYGYAFQKANFQDWGEGPAGDVLAAVDHALLKDWVDPERLVVTGGSYAGYLTAWIVAHDHRFKAAVAQRGVYDLTTFFGEGNAWRLVQWAFGGHPFEARFKQIIERNSPFTYVNRIRTPLLILHASQDLRTGVSQSEMLYRALKALDRPVEYVRYPNADHDLSRTGDPKQRMDRLNRIIEFFERHIENPRPAPVTSGT